MSKVSRILRRLAVYGMFVVPACTFSQGRNSVPTHRTDGRYIGTYAYLHHMLRNHKPVFSYDKAVSRADFGRWQDSVRSAMAALMKFPEPESQVPPRCVLKEKKDGYMLEKWELYPLPGLVTSFLVLKPDTAVGLLPAVMCIPGSSRTKEGLAGEKGVEDCYTEDIRDAHVTMALDYVKSGYVAVAVDNAGAGEAADIESASGSTNFNYDIVSRILLEMDWSWLGYTSFVDMQILKWMKTYPGIDNKRIILSGFSLGTEPMMVLGVLDRDVFAFVYNDFLCNTQERAVVMTKPVNGRRVFPNSIRHLIPGYWKYFNFPDVVASLAPRPIIFTEGGLDRDFDLVKNAYDKVGALENVVCCHYPKYADKSSRTDIEHLPEGLDASAYFRHVNVDTENHYFKLELVLPWIETILHSH